jgi:hypothetical protein
LLDSVTFRREISCWILSHFPPKMLFIFSGNLSIAGNAPLLPESSPFSPETLLSRRSGAHSLSLVDYLY